MCHVFLASTKDFITTLIIYTIFFLQSMVRSYVRYHKVLKRFSQTGYCIYSVNIIEGKVVYGVYSVSSSGL